MFQCAWCKKKTNVDKWSKDGEPLCLECAHKYNFGLEQGMIKGNVSVLSKEQRREISERRNNFERFWGALRSVDREVLVGCAKIFSHTVGWTFFIILILGLMVLQTTTLPDWFIFHGFLGRIVGIVAIPAYIFLAYLLHRRIVWHIKYWQLKRKARESGYGGI